MAEISYTRERTGKGDEIIAWNSVTENDTFQPILLEEVVSEISVHVYGDFGGATMLLQGSNDGSNYANLQQIGLTDASATSTEIFSVLDRPLYIKPTASGGTSQSLTIKMLVRK